MQEPQFTNGHLADRSRTLNHPGNRGVRTRLPRKIRYTSVEWNIITERARLCGKAPARYVRETSLGVTPKVRSAQTDAALIRELGQIGTALTRLASMAKEQGVIGHAANLDSVLEEILSVVRRLG